MVMAHPLGLARNAARVDARKEQPLHGARAASNAGEINKVNGVEVRPKGHTLYIT